MTITLATLNDATPQQVFDQVATHLMKQGLVSRTEYGCKYRAMNEKTGETLKCAVGCLMSDAEYSPMMENISWRHLRDQPELTTPVLPSRHDDLLSSLQNIHDGIPAAFTLQKSRTRAHWAQKLTAFAARNGLTVPKIVSRYLPEGGATATI
jgi:hypothetical protein